VVLKARVLGYIAPLVFGCCALGLAQENLPAGKPPDHDLPTFQTKVDLVLVPVVVRDRHHRPVANLTRDDFRLFDNGKPQTIASFSTVVRAGNRESTPNSAAPPAAGPGRPAGDAETHNRERFFVYLFDDGHTRFADMANLRAAALSFFENNFAAGDRAAVYTVSGRNALEFTSDRNALADAVSKLKWGQLPGSGGMGCPDVSYYIADLVVNKADSLALEGLTNHTVECAHVRWEVAIELAKAAANRELILGARNTQLALSALRRAIRSLSRVPGQRVIVLSSPGFFAQGPEAIKATAEVLDLAARNDVIINGLSPRGVILAEEEEDVTRRATISRRAPPSATSPPQLWIRYRRESARADGDVMNDLAHGTGGIVFHDNNNLRAGFEQVTEAPEFSYVLGFSPGQLKPDGSFHSLRVRLQNTPGAGIEARRGYYALQPGPKSGRSSMSEMEDAIFSRDEKSGLPVVLQTGYSKPKDAGRAKVLITAKIDVTSLPRKEPGGGTPDSMDVAVALFSQEGGYVTGTAEAVTFGAPDPSVTLHWEFPEINLASYIVRLVIRQSRGQALTAINRTLTVF
jgi:VWFA-related protein